MVKTCNNHVHYLGDESEIVTFGEVIQAFANLLYSCKNNREDAKARAFVRALDNWDGWAEIHGESMSIRSSDKSKVYVIDENLCDCEYKGGKTICWHRAIYQSIVAAIQKRQVTNNESNN